MYNGYFQLFLTEGLVMSTPLRSAIISRTFLEEINEQIIRIKQTRDPPGKYYRYVDDTINIQQNSGKEI